MVIYSNKFKNIFVGFVYETQDLFVYFLTGSVIEIDNSELVDKA